MTTTGTTTPRADLHADALRAALSAAPVVAILRARSAERLPEVCEALAAGGIRVLELTLTTSGALAALTRLRDRLPDVLLGAGSVCTTEQVDACAEAGAQFLVSPISDPALTERARHHRLPHVPGALTPTEIQAAWAGGAATVKVFPAGPVGGTSYLRAVRGPLPDVPLLPTGGIDIDEVGDYLATGAAAVGLGGTLQGSAADPGGDLEALAERARRAVAQVRP